MFTNLIESDSHRQEFKRRSSFFLATVAAYALILSAAGVASIYAYDAHLEAQTGGLELINWVPPVTPVAPIVRPRDLQPIHRSAPSNAPVDRNVSVAERINPTARTDDPSRVPDHPGTAAATEPPVSGPFRLSNRNVDPPSTGPNTSAGCVTCNGTAPVVKVDETPPTPPIVKPPTTQRLPSTVLISKAISLPQPPYPPLAKQIHAQGSVNVQILVDEQGRVISAQAVSGNPMLLLAAKEAAQRARFSPTVLNGQAVKVQGVITYNFVLQ
ncbi:MAG: periplasmic protein TonB [Blastocatellia bacterium]|jgi:protein TonB|nr:periplasmic protein TonB [Blastocatellia bacterium]